MSQVEASKRQLMAELLVGVHRICNESGVAPGDLAYVMPRHDGGHQRRPRREGCACGPDHDAGLQADPAPCAFTNALPERLLALKRGHWVIEMV
jgi:hypothetical protein